MTAEMCVIFNPSAGRGRALRRLARLRRALGARADFLPTQRPAHAEELAFQAAQDGYRVVGAAGGDGTVHEVANGLLRAERPEVGLAVFPVGSANDYAHSLGLEPGWWRSGGPASHRAVDVGWVRDPDGRQRYFINGLGLGFNGMVTLEARRIHGLQGIPLYGLALLRALYYHYDSPMMTVTMDGESRQAPTLALTVAIGRREGNFILAPHADVADGLFDYLHVGPLARWRLLRYVPNMITGRLPTQEPNIRMARCTCVSVASARPLMIHIDGEFFSRPEDNVRAVDIGILPGRLRVLQALGA